MIVATDTWVGALARLQQDLDALDRALATGAEVVTLPWTPPGDLGPIPDDLRLRAEELLGRIGRATERLRGAQAGLAGQRQDVDRRRAASAAYHGIAREKDRHHTA